MSVLNDALRMLGESAAREPSVLVAYSDGKDSRVVLDLCMRTFTQVECFFMYLVPGLECIDSALFEAEKRFGVKIRQYPHWVAAKAIRGGVFCNPRNRYDDLPQWKLHDVYALAMAEAGIRQIATGAKKADSAWRRRFMSVKNSELIQPIADWHKYDVLSYLKARGIPLPPSSGHSATGIDLSPKSLIWLAETYPEDFRRVCEFFPYAESVVWQRRFYG